MIRSVNATWYWAAGLVFLAALTIAITVFGSYYIQLVTSIAVSGGGVIFYMAGIRKSFHVVLFSLPLSLNIPVIGENQVMFPSELLVAALAISVFLHWLRDGSGFNALFRHPVTCLLVGYMFFVVISLFFSDMLIVSIKSVIVKMLYIIAFFGGAYLYFVDRRPGMKWISYYLVPLVAVVIYSLVRHAGFSFSKDVSGLVTKPFFQDHTIYSTAIAFIFPLATFQLFTSRGSMKLVYIFTLLLLAAALFFAGSRAAWLSAGVAIILGTLSAAGFSPKGFLVLFLGSWLLIFAVSDDIMLMLKSNRFDSNARHAGIEEQTKSVVNITNDQSNAERINRWKCALRMFREKPFTGFGPGTYQFTYFPFQRESEMTRISVTSPYNIEDGRGGTAHNEYLLALAESGVGAALFFIMMVLFTCAIALRLCYEAVNDFRPLAMLFAFTTFAVHIFFNNFLDTDKTAVLFYMAIAFFIAHDRSDSKSPEHA